MHDVYKLKVVELSELLERLQDKLNLAAKAD